MYNKEHKMTKINKKRVYRDLMRMDGARMRDLNTASKLDLAGATVGPIAGRQTKAREPASE